MNKKAARIIVLTLTVLLLLITSFTGWVQANPNPQETRGTVLYVSSGGSGACTSWADACDLQAAFTAAITTDEIWVQAGTYLPTNTTDRTISFVLKNGVAIYGGFAGTETALDQRDWTGNSTILSGDIGVTGNTSDNSFHVLYGDALSAATILDGFTITAGNATNGIDNSDFYGGGMYNFNNSNLTLINVTFSDNTARYAGGMFNESNSNSSLTNVTFSANTTTYGSGGGMLNNESSPTLTNVTFSGNIALKDGGGMYNASNSSPILTNVNFIGNTADEDGGGISNYFFSNPTLANVTFSDNTASDNGGGMHNMGCSPMLTNVTFFSNSATRGGGMYNIQSSPTLIGVTFSTNNSGAGGGIYNYISSPTLTNVTISGNTSAYDGGGMYNYSANNPTMTNVTISGNTAAIDGGGIYNYQSNPTLTNVTLSFNKASRYGGGLYNYESNPTLTNTILWGNTPAVQVQNYSKTSTSIITYSDIQGGYAGTGNIDADPFLAPLGNNGGFTQTHALLPLSAAIDTANPASCPASDQRGQDRPIDGDGDGIPECDMGAYEFNSWLKFVDKDAIGLNNGTSWANAFTDLQDALAVADQGSEIWVAEGTYKPTTTTERDAYFVLKNGVAIFGGFDGTESTRDQRDWTSNLTILSGEIGSIGDTGDNSYHVVYGLQVDATAILDGFTIISGNGNGSNPPNDLGGGMYNAYDSSPTLTNLTFANNTAWGGGGIYNYVDSSPTLTNITFSNNSAVFGGGMFNHSANPSLTNVTFSGNSASSEGGGIYNYESSPSLTNVTFSNNLAEYGGGMSNYNNSSPSLTNITFSNNSATLGGGIYNTTNSNPTLTNIILWSNSIGQVFNDGTSNSDITYSDIQGGYTGIGNIDQDPLLGPLTDNGGFTLTQALLTGSPAIDTGTNTGCPLTDQRGYVRPIDGDWDGTPECDMGAYEYQAWFVFVDKDAAGLNNGTSWPNAFTDLQDALAIADQGIEIWVAEGTYKPTATTDRELYFALKNDVAIYGGFAGIETALDQRDWTGNPTILSGDIGVTGVNSDNSYHVVYGTSLSATTILDGFTITAGKADGINSPSNAGGGMHNTTDSSPTLTNLIFSNNTATYGGGMTNDTDCSPMLTNVIFSNNSAVYGGGMYNRVNYNSTLTNVTFSGNSATASGGGMTNVDYSSPTLTNVTFSGNIAINGGGGGMINDNRSSPKLTNVTFSSNSTNWSGGGGMINNLDSNPMLTNVIFSGNISAGSGGAMYNQMSNPTLTYVTFSNNSADRGGGMLNNASSNPTLTNVTFSGNIASDLGGGLLNDNNSNPTLINVTFYGNSAILGGGVFNFGSDPTLTNAILWGNSPALQVYNESSTPTIIYSDVQGGYTGTGNIDLDPLLGALANNGGFTLMHALLTGSPAIDTGSPSICPATDQRGYVRPIDGDGNGSLRCDMGAYEYGSHPSFTIFLPLIIR